MQELREMLDLVLNNNQEKNRKMDELQREVVRLRKTKEVNLTMEDDDTGEIIPTETKKSDDIHAMKTKFSC